MHLAEVCLRPVQHEQRLTKCLRQQAGENALQCLPAEVGLVEPFFGARQIDRQDHIDQVGELCFKSKQTPAHGAVGRQAGMIFASIERLTLV